IINMQVIKTFIQSSFSQIKIIEALDGKEALKLYKIFNPTMVITDIQMPLLNGYELCEAIRKENVNVPIIALTAGTVKGEKEKCNKVGMNDYVTKPVIQETIREVISKWLK
ncbi:MAG: response regulator, partial [Ferruginibacter sp.]